jgi:3-oxoacyl-[acyl-carrier protein] reductase
MPVKNKVVLITGAARGMGREHTRGFLKQGAKVIATDLMWAPTGASSDEVSFLEEIKDNPNVLVEVMDITIDSHVKRVYREAMKKFGTIDVILNNAGMRARDLYPDVGGRITLLETEVGDWQRLFDTHVFGNFRVIKTFSAPMVEKRSGSIINVGTGNFNPNSMEGPYPMAKAALSQMTMFFAAELKPYNIAANMLLPSLTRTTGSDTQTAMRLASGGRFFPRLRPDSVVPLALYLAEQDASTGETGKSFEVLKWNQAHELGGLEDWVYEEDLKTMKEINFQMPQR